MADGHNIHISRQKWTHTVMCHRMVRKEFISQTGSSWQWLKPPLFTNVKKRTHKSLRWMGSKSRRSRQVQLVSAKDEDPKASSRSTDASPVFGLMKAFHNIRCEKKTKKNLGQVAFLEQHPPVSYSLMFQWIWGRYIRRAEVPTAITVDSTPKIPSVEPHPLPKFTLSYTNPPQSLVLFPLPTAFGFN